VSYEILIDDCLDALRSMPDESVQLIVTSPPYASQRDYDTESGFKPIRPREYVQWWLPRAAEMMRVLKPAGTLIVNIKENVTSGERDTYVYDMVLAMREQGCL